MTDMQKSVREFVEEHGLQTSVETRVLDLVSEVGELAKEVLKGSGYGKEPFQATASWEEELGDVLFSLLCVVNETGVDAEQALGKVLEKYRLRFASKGEIGSGR